MKCFQVVVLAAILSSVSSKNLLNGWYPCSDYTFSDEGSSGDIEAECAMYIAPLCYPDICDATEASERTVDIFVKRMLAVEEDSETSTNVWVLQGGPGYSSTAMESLMIDLYNQLGGQVNVYTMDHRGTGRSTFLDCVAAQVVTTGSPQGKKIDPAEVPACAQDLAMKYGDLASFSITSAALDLSTFIAQYSNGANTTVYGVSYGTAWVERLVHLDPPTVTGYVLDSVATSSGAKSADKFEYFSTWNIDFGEAGDAFLKLCDHDKECRSRFEPKGLTSTLVLDSVATSSGAKSADKFEYFSTWNIDFGEAGDAFLKLCDHDKECRSRFEPKGLTSTLVEVIAKFDHDPNSTCAALMNNVKSDLKNESPSMILRGALSWLLQGLTARKLIPPAVYRLNRCTTDDVDVLTHFISTLNVDLNYSSQDDNFYSSLLYFLTIFSEMWETPSPSIEEMRKRFTDASISDSEVYLDTSLYCAFSKEDSEVCNQLNVSNYLGNGILYQRDQYWNKSATIPEKASVLLLNGILDPATPYKYAEYLREALEGENKELITFNYSVHDTISSTPLTEDGSRNETCGLTLLVSYVKNNGNLNNLDKSCLQEMPEFNLTLPIESQSQYFATNDAYDGVYNFSLSQELLSD